MAKGWELRRYRANMPAVMKTRGTNRRGYLWTGGALAALLSLSAVTISADASAVTPKIALQGADWKVKKEAKEAYKEGKTAFDKGDYPTALTHFQKADELYPGFAPKHQIALCFDKLGKVAEAIAAYRAFINSKPDQKYADRVVEAGKRIAELETQLPATVTLAVTPPTVEGMTITVDGQPAQGPELQLPPGEHTIIITAPGHSPVTETVSVSGGQKMDLPVTLTPEGPVVPPPGDDDDDDGADDPGLPLKIAGFAVGGVAIAAGVVSGAFGVMALGSKSDFESTPTNELADDAESQALVSDIFLGVGVGCAIGAGVLLYFGFTAEGEEEAAASTTPVVVPYGGPEGGGAMATWTF